MIVVVKKHLKMTYDIKMLLSTDINGVKTE